MQLLATSAQRGGSSSGSQPHDFNRTHQRSLSDPLPGNVTSTISAHKETKSGMDGITEQFRNRLSIDSKTQTETKDKADGIFATEIPAYVNDARTYEERLINVTYYGEGR